MADGFAAGTTGGAGGATVTVTNQADLERYAKAAGPHVIRVDRAITISPLGREIPVASDKTIVGVGFFLGSGTANVIIRNLTVRDTRVASDDPDDKEFDHDAIQLDTADRVWIDHNRLTRMNDGLIDSRKDTTNLTVSWNVLAENNKTFGIGWTENTTARITIHHNWIHHTNQNSYFDTVKDPFYKDDTAQLRQTGSIVVNSTGKQQTGGTAFTPSSFYSYTPDRAADVPALVRTYAGPQADIGV